MPYSAAVALSIGVQLPEAEYVARWTDIAAMAAAAEAIGLDSLWVGDHLLYDTPTGQVAPWEAWTQLAALAAITKKIQLGPLVAATSFHNPAMLAKKVATIQEIAGGRLILGLGAGWNEVEYKAYGFPFDRRASRFEEAFTIIRTLLADGWIDFRGEFYQLENCRLLPRTQPPPEMLIGSRGERVLRATLPYVHSWNAWFTWFKNDPEQLRPLLAMVDRLCEQVGRPPSEVARTVAVWVGFPDGGRPERGYAVPEGVNPITGSPSQITEQLTRFAALGIDHLQLVLQPITTRSIEALHPVLQELGR